MTVVVKHTPINLPIEVWLHVTQYFSFDVWEKSVKLDDMKEFFICRHVLTFNIHQAENKS